MSRGTNQWFLLSPVLVLIVPFRCNWVTDRGGGGERSRSITHSALLCLSSSNLDGKSGKVFIVGCRVCIGADWSAISTISDSTLCRARQTENVRFEIQEENQKLHSYIEIYYRRYQKIIKHLITINSFQIQIDGNYSQNRTNFSQQARKWKNICRDSLCLSQVISIEIK